MVDAPLLMLGRPLRTDTVVREMRDAQGRRIKRVYKRHADTGNVHAHETYLPAGNNDALMRPPTTRVTLSAREFGMTQRQLAEVVARAFPTVDRRTPAGLFLP